MRRFVSLFRKTEMVKKVLTSWSHFTKYPYPLLVRLSLGLKAGCFFVCFDISLHFHNHQHGKFNYNSDETDFKALAEVTIFLW